jgi:hypothetical protein
MFEMCFNQHILCEHKDLCFYHKLRVMFTFTIFMKCVYEVRNDWTLLGVYKASSVNFIKVQSVERNIL